MNEWLKVSLRQLVVSSYLALIWHSKQFHSASGAFLSLCVCWLLSVILDHWSVRSVTCRWNIDNEYDIVASKVARRRKIATKRRHSDSHDVAISDKNRSAHAGPVFRISDLQVVHRTRFRTSRTRPFGFPVSLKNKKASFRADCGNSVFILEL